MGVLCIYLLAVIVRNIKRLGFVLCRLRNSSSIKYDPYYLFCQYFDVGLWYIQKVNDKIE